MKKWLAAALTFAVLTTATGCSIGGQEVLSQENKDKLTEKANDLTQQATDAVNKLKENPDLQQFLLDQAGATGAKVEQFMTDLMKDPVVIQATQQLGQDVVRDVIQSAVLENNGVFDAFLITIITNELEKRMGQ